jgi:hypothetical protein
MGMARVILCSVVFTSLCSSIPAGIAQWDFNGDLESTTGQNAAIEGAGPPAAFPEYTFDTAQIGGKSADVVHFTRGTFFHLMPGLPPNGGGAYVNQYTILMDVMFPDRSPSGGWASLYQTNEANSNDGDWFISDTGALGISGNYGGLVPEGEWHRLGLVVDLAVGTFTSYIDGVQVQQLTGQALDDRFALYSKNDGGNDGFSIFADESGDSAEGFVNSVQFRDVALPASAMAALGGPTAEGLPIPPDPRDCAFRSFTVFYDPGANTVNGTWESIAGDEGFQVVQGARVVAESLPADATNFEDIAPPKNGVGVVYTLKTIVGGSVERECPSTPVDTVGCIGNFSYCAAQATRTVTLSWSPPVNAEVSGYDLLRDGTVVASAPPAALLAIDPDAPVGRHLYEVNVKAGATTICTVGTHVLVNGIDLGGAGPCGTINQYDFNGDLASSTGGQDLVAQVSDPIPAGGQPEVTFEDATINGATAKVARYSRGTIFKMRTALPANGGGAYVNQYTLIMDLMFEPGALDESGWAAIYNTNAENGNPADFWVQGANRTVGASGLYGGHVEDGEWFRLAVVQDSIQETLTAYISGVFAMQKTGQGIDNDWTLYTIDQPDEGIHLFADNGSFNSRGLVNSVQIRDVALNADEIAALGGPTAAGIPSTPTCPYLFTAAVDATAHSVSLSWKIGAAPLGSAFALRRDGQPLAEVPLTQTSFADSGLTPGVHRYELAFKEKDTGCINLPLVAQVEIPADGVLFYENFDRYADDAALRTAGWAEADENSPVEHAAWTLSNPSGIENPPSWSGRPTSGKFVVSDSGYGGLFGENVAGSGMSHDLVSPPIAIHDDGPVWLHFDAVAQLNNDGDAVFDVDVSTDGGANWSNVFRRISPGRTANPAPEFGTTADGAFGRIHVDLSSVAPDGSSILLRFRHFEPTFDWHVAVDNVQIDHSPPEGGHVVLATVDFSGGIPGGWSLASGPDSDGLDPWSTEDSCNVSIGPQGTFPDAGEGRMLHHLDSAFALVDPFCVSAKYDEYLVTPPLDLTAESRVFLGFESAILLGFDTRAEVLLSLDGGTTFLTEPIFSYTLGAAIIRGEEPFYDDFAIEVPAAAGKANVAFAFHYKTLLDSGGVNTGWWAVDSVRVTSTRATSEARFVRGDVDGSGAIDITDVVNNLGYQFLGTFTPSCLEALDDDDSGVLDISDPVFSLGRQFLGGPVWQAPNPGCGVDPTADALGCQQTADGCK